MPLNLFAYMNKIDQSIPPILLSWTFANWLEPNFFAQALEEYAQGISRKGSPLQNCFGVKRVHSLKYQSIALPNGLTRKLYGPVGVLSLIFLAMTKLNWGLRTSFSYWTPLTFQKEETRCRYASRFWSFETVWVLCVFSCWPAHVCFWWSSHINVEDTEKDSRSV